MKNIYNLLTDAFDRINLDECDYIKNVEGNYRITITSNNITGSATLDLYMNTNNELLDYDDTNSLFVNDSWSEFCATFEEHIRQPINSVSTTFITANDLFRSLLMNANAQNLIPPNLIPEGQFEDDDEIPPLVYNEVPNEDVYSDED
jgi:hypothetical protein